MAMKNRHYSDFFDIDYFIDYFSDIPPKQWSTTDDKSSFDAYGWCDKEEAKALYGLTEKWGYLDDVNDGKPGYEFFGDTIKSRIINFLEYIRSKTEDES